MGSAIHGVGSCIHTFTAPFFYKRTHRCAVVQLTRFSKVLMQRLLENEA